VLAVASLLLLRSKEKHSEEQSVSEQTLLLLVTVTALCSNIQFPYAPGYFCYVAPLAILLAANLLSRFARPPRMILYTTYAFYLCFAVLHMRPHAFGSHQHLDFDSTTLDLERARGLRVSKQSAEEYTELIPFIKKLAGQNAIIAGPDCPEVYFLAGLKNPTPLFFDFVETPQEYRARLVSLLQRPEFGVAVTNDAPLFSSEQLSILRPLLAAQFPQSRKFGKFTVYWKP
jgi:hypothetical protein